MRNIVIFGLGEMGKKLINECQTYGKEINVVTVVDNNANVNNYQNIPVIKSEKIIEYCYDEIWICTVYFKDIMEQLSFNYAVNRDKMYFVEPVIPVLEERLRNKYKEQMCNLELLEDELKKVLTYLKDNPLRMYCYSFYDEYLNKNSEIFFDNDKGLYYGMYEKKRMYLARRLNTEEKARAYYNGVIMEQDTRSPHCYWNNERLLKATGVGVDVGAAEGIFALKIIEQVKHIYLIEADEQWIEALKYTFEDYLDKVTILNKFIGNKDLGDNARLDTLLATQRIDFIKMDIEGMELEALLGAEELLRCNAVELAVCVYHHQSDNEKIGVWLKEKGYRSFNSKGLVVCQGEWELEKDETDFRKALLFATK